MDAGWTWLLIQAVSTPHSSCPELQRWTNQLPEQSEFVPVIKLNVIRLYTHCGGLLTEEDWQEMFRKKRSNSWTLLLWTNWSACRTSPTPPLIGLLCCLCSLCVTQTINSQSQWSGVLPNEPRDTGSGGWMTPAEDRARGQRGWRCICKTTAYQTPNRRWSIVWTWGARWSRQFTEHIKYCMPANMSLHVVLW